MPDLTGLVLPQLLTMTKPELVAAITAWLNRPVVTRRQIIGTLRDMDEDALVDDAANLTFFKNGDRDTLTTTIRDVLGQKVGTRQVKWTYNEARQVDRITTTVLDAADKIVEQWYIQHYLDWRKGKPQRIDVLTGPSLMAPVDAVEETMRTMPETTLVSPATERTLPWALIIMAVGVVVAISVTFARC